MQVPRTVWSFAWFGRPHGSVARTVRSFAQSGDAWIIGEACIHGAVFSVVRWLKDAHRMMGGISRGTMPDLEFHSLRHEPVSAARLFSAWRRAACIVFLRSMARVINPTPPGTGVIHEAFGSTPSKSTSPTRR